MVLGCNRHSVDPVAAGSDRTVYAVASVPDEGLVSDWQAECSVKEPCAFIRLRGRAEHRAHHSAFLVGDFDHM